MRKIAIMILLFIAVSFAIRVPSLWAQPNEVSLIQAWEKLQENDSKTITFEKKGDHRYKFKTEYFPFAGELRIKDMLIDEIGLGPENDFILGAVEVELVGLPKDFTQKFDRKYSMWARNNTLYYDKKNGKWLSPREFQNVIIRKTKQWSNPGWGISDYAIIVLVVVGLAIVFRISRRTGLITKTTLQKQAEAMAQSAIAILLSKKSVQLAEESNELLKEILEVLKSKNRE
jgi:hypothetical protein